MFIYFNFLFFAKLQIFVEKFERDYDQMRIKVHVLSIL